MFRTVLVANRGEIAVRVIRTLRRLGVRSVAVYSDADAGARHVRDADVAVRLGPAPARESYLSIERVLDAARSTGAEAIHPGYGFLAENAAFARACAEAGVVLVGPAAAAMETMGDKIRAKIAVAAAGVPVVPGRAELGMTDADLVDSAAEIGFPVLVKPSAGGGGKGMHVVRSVADLAEALRTARREAAASFGDDTLFLERYVDRPRHIEVQVLADAHGTTLHLGERECSLQRRHQKIVEEAPSPLLTPEQRERYGALAVATARAVDYTGAGTVEFIVAAERPDEPFFMEMNTRLQVEHPVTELVTGLDLVELQLRVAAGEPLGLVQSDVALTGHAVEARIYAEDPARGFLPTGGRALVLREPVVEGVRVDSGLLEGADVGTTYDPMLSKVVAWGADRPEALARLDAALAANVVLGVGTNTGFLRALLRAPDVAAGRLDTGLVEREGAALAVAELPEAVLAAYALIGLHGLWPSTPGEVWDLPTGWRVGAPRPLRSEVAGPDGERLRLEVTGPPQAALVRVGDRTLRGSVVAAADGVLVTVDDVSRTVLSAVDGSTTWLAMDGATWAVHALPALRRGRADGVAEADVRSPMPGAVIALRAAAGDTVAAGDPLLVVEAMKMEHVLTAPSGGVLDLLVREGDQVVVDQVVARVVADTRSPDVQPYPEPDPARPQEA